jgi:hypothetical protein
MAWTGDKEHVRSAVTDQSVEVGIDEIYVRHSSPVTEQSCLMYCARNGSSNRQLSRR